MLRVKLRGLALLSLLSLVACKSTAEEAPSDAAIVARDASDSAVDVASDATPDVATDANDAAADVGDAATDSSDASDATSDSATDASDAATDASDAATDAPVDVRDAASDASCVSDGGCFACPSTSSEIINRCTASSCARFDRTRLTRLLTDGGLPPLP